MLKGTKGATFNALELFKEKIRKYKVLLQRKTHAFHFSTWERFRLLLFSIYWSHCPAGNYMFKVNNKSTRRRCEICLKLITKIPERQRFPHLSITGVIFAVNRLECFIENKNSIRTFWEWRYSMKKKKKENSSLIRNLLALIKWSISNIKLFSMMKLFSRN